MFSEWFPVDNLPGALEQQELNVFTEAILAQKLATTEEILQRSEAKVRLLESQPFEEGTALHFACKCGNYDLVCLLLRHGAPVNVMSRKNHFTPLHEATNHLDIFEVLLRQGADGNIPNIDGNIPLHYLVRRKFQPLQYSKLAQAWQKMLDSGVNLDHANTEGETALHCACRHGQSLFTRWLIERSSNLNVTNKF